MVEKSKEEKEKRYLHIIYTTIRIWRHPSPGIITVRRKKDAVYNPGEHSPTSLPKPRTVLLPGAIRQVSLQDWGLEDRYSPESRVSHHQGWPEQLWWQDRRSVPVREGVWWRQAPHKCSTTLPPPLLQGSATPWRGGSAVPLFRYRVLGHRHWKRETPEGSNETLGIRKVLYMQYMA